MLNWIAANLATIIVCAVLLAVTTVIVVQIISNRKKGKTSCGCGCEGCAMGGSCHQKQH